MIQEWSGPYPGHGLDAGHGLDPSDPGMHAAAGSLSQMEMLLGCPAPGPPLRSCGGEERLGAGTLAYLSYMQPCMGGSAGSEHMSNQQVSAPLRVGAPEVTPEVKGPPRLRDPRGDP